MILQSSALNWIETIKTYTGASVCSIPIAIAIPAHISGSVGQTGSPGLPLDTTEVTDMHITEVTDMGITEVRDMEITIKIPLHRLHHLLIPVEELFLVVTEAVPTSLPTPVMD